MTLPRLVIIDDQLGGTDGQGRNRDREDRCQQFALRDTTRDAEVETLPDPLAEAVFIRGQRVVGNQVQNDLEGTLAQIRNGWLATPRWALLLLDLHFKTGQAGPDGQAVGLGTPDDRSSYFGLLLLERLRADSDLRRLPVVVLSSEDRGGMQGEIERRFADSGALGFVSKTDLDRQRMAGLLRSHALLEDSHVLDEMGQWIPRPGPVILGRSVALLDALRQVRLRAELGNQNVLILGETGTGKELAARYAHDWSPRRGRTYETLLVNESSPELIPDRLFGHEKGAFTGASTAREGAAELADGGTLFIDEFGDLSRDVQNSFLRLLDASLREVHRLGSNKARQVDLQVVLATNDFRLREREDFRHDILARVGPPITLPPLRDRTGDLPLLAEHFLRRAERDYQAERREVAEDAADVLWTHSWPGNVRELTGVIDLAVGRHRGLRVLVPRHLPIEPEPANSEKDPGEKPAAVAPLLPCPSEIVALLEGADESQWERGDLRGQLPQLEDAFARLLFRLLRQALTTTADPLDESQSYTRAVNLLLGLGRDDGRQSTACKAVIKKMAAHARNPGQLSDLLASPPFDENPYPDLLKRYLKP